MEAAFRGADANNLYNGSTAYRRIGLLAAMKQIASALDGRSKSSGSMLIDEGQIAKPIKDFHWYGISTFHGVDGSEKQILIEWLEYDESWADRKNELIQRVQDITSFRAPLSASHAFPVLTSAGYFHDVVKHSFGIVYYFPPRQPEPSLSIPDMEKPRSLRDIISKKFEDTTAFFGSSLRYSTEIGKCGADHAQSELAPQKHFFIQHQFFPDRFRSIAEAMTEPYFTGFSYSRLNLETAFTQGPHIQLEYQHPEYPIGFACGEKQTDKPGPGPFIYIDWHG